MLIVAPHLDDAVFSCGALIASLRRVTVVTVCAGIPAPDVPPSGFDRAAGFHSAADAIRARRKEDKAAGEVLGYSVVHLDCLSDEYDRVNVGTGRHRHQASAPGRADRVQVATVEALALTDGIILAPLGLRHPDHELVAATCLQHARGAVFYEELPYRALWPEFTAPALAKAGRTVRLSALGLLRDPEAIALKALAVQCYPSQIIGMDTSALLADEVYHRVIP